MLPPELKYFQPLSMDQILDIKRSLNKNQLQQFILGDPKVDMADKQALGHVLADPSLYESLFAGTTGAAMAYMLSKYLNLEKPVQVLLSLAGFGVGNIILDNLKSKQQLSTSSPNWVDRIKL